MQRGHSFHSETANHVGTNCSHCYSPGKFGKVTVETHIQHYACSWEWGRENEVAWRWVRLVTGHSQRPSPSLHKQCYLQTVFHVSRSIPPCSSHRSQQLGRSKSRCRFGTRMARNAQVMIQSLLEYICIFLVSGPFNRSHLKSTSVREACCSLRLH